MEIQLNRRCDLSYGQALDCVTTIIGINWAELQRPMGLDAVPIRDAVAKKIVDTLFNKKTKKLYTSQSPK